MSAVTTHQAPTRRGFLRGAIGVALGAGAAAALPAAATAAIPAADPMLPFVSHYTSNLGANLTAGSNAAVDLLSGMARLWHTGPAWNAGQAIDRELLRANMRHSIEVTGRRTADQAKQAFLHDRQDQSYGMIDGLGPLAALYRVGALAVSSVTTAPDGTPPGPVDDTVPPGAPAGSATGAGSPTSALGAVVTLVQTLRGTYSSGNPSKNAYGYPRPWRMNLDSEVQDTGALDAFGYPVYRSPVQVAPQLLRQRGTTPATDGGFPSGHTNAFFLAGLAYAHAVPERFQELVTRAHELADSRITAGMHSALDVIGGRILATALAAAILADPVNTAAKADARAQALSYFTEKTGTDDLFAAAHTGGPDAYADRAANAALVARCRSYGLPRRGPQDVPMTVPQGAEVLLETRLPYLTAEQRREVLRSTALPSGQPLLDGPELWGRLDLFTAADGYGAFAQDVSVTMDATRRGFHAADTWRNDIGGPGGLTKLGTGALTLTGRNCYRGGTRVREGVLAAAGPAALGHGAVELTGGTLALTGVPTLHGSLTVRGATLDLALSGQLEVAGSVHLGPDAVLTLRLAQAPTGAELPVLRARRLFGTFQSVVARDAAGRSYRVETCYHGTALTVRVHP
ncbi:phosphatase PAP2 family protein [Kitasatospora viridis]|uniref:Autotransporter-associated beta strand protein n=1 Tax=Kitasatospora viridis TaxID=281105 RepID=A0A561TVR0_9ACTN|nr:phosphatase PAP2 family protein [Kitasatospora viridis]TWF91202.1 autotransporter-associated beta strand protein [Kitasatospora viridis]